VYFDGTLVPGCDVERCVSVGVLYLGVGELELVEELAGHVHVTGGDVQRRVATRRPVALPVQQPETCVHLFIYKFIIHLFISGQGLSST